MSFHYTRRAVLSRGAGIFGPLYMAARCHVCHKRHKSPTVKNGPLIELKIRRGKEEMNGKTPMRMATVMVWQKFEEL